MVLVYLRFDDKGEVSVTHVLTRNKEQCLAITAMAEQHGFTPTARLVECRVFECSGTFTEAAASSEFVGMTDFKRRWELVE